MADTIIQLNKTKLLASESRTSTGVQEITFATESDAVRFMWFIPEIMPGSSIWGQLYEVTGSTVGNDLLLFSSKTFTTRQEPFVYIATGGQKFKVVIHYSGTVQYELFATGISGSAAIVATQKTIDNSEEVIWRNRMLVELEQIKDNMALMVNHLRVITDLNTDEGEDY